MIYGVDFIAEIMTRDDLVSNIFEFAIVWSR